VAIAQLPKVFYRGSVVCTDFSKRCEGCRKKRFDGGSQLLGNVREIGRISMLTVKAFPHLVNPVVRLAFK
tara:strand:- start:16501 stop:16710 length:210 start_codon:yes stop_codon:yes gene_type:complete